MTDRVSTRIKSGTLRMGVTIYETLRKRQHAQRYTAILKRASQERVVSRSGIDHIRISARRIRARLDSGSSPQEDLRPQQHPQALLGHAGPVADLHGTESRWCYRCARADEMNLQIICWGSPSFPHFHIRRPVCFH